MLECVARRLSVWDEVLNNDRQMEACCRERTTIFSDLESAEMRVYDWFDHTYISTVLTTDVVRGFRSKSGYIISAQTGSGKSTEVNRILIPLALEKQKKVLIIVPRKALSLQYKRLIAEAYAPDILQNYTEKGMAQLHEIGPADIYLMQEIGLPNVKEMLLRQKANYDFVIFDEVDSFFRDSSFNQYTQSIFEFLIRFVGKSCIRVYMSATVEVMLDAIVDIENGLAYDYVVDLKEFLGIHNTKGYASHELKLFRFRQNFSYAQPVFFTETEELVEHLILLPASTKTVIFVESRKHGEELRGKLSDAVFMDAETKESREKETFKTIIHQHTFMQRFLIVTRFLDVGIDLKDLKISNIVIFSSIREDILQMMGRKRITRNEIVNIFLYVPKCAELQRKIRQLDHSYEEMQAGLSMYKNLREYAFTEIPHPLYVRKTAEGISLNYNAFSFQVNRYYRRNLTELLGDYVESSDDFYDHYKNTILKWIPSCKEGKWLNGDMDKVLTEILDLYVDKELDRDERKMFDQKFFAHTGVTRRKSQEDNIGTKTVNEYFNTHSLPYFMRGLSKEGQPQMWKLERR